jgi:hypothetical protein
MALPFRNATSTTTRTSKTRANRRLRTYTEYWCGGRVVRDVHGHCCTVVDVRAVSAKHAKLCVYRGIVSSNEHEAGIVAFYEGPRCAVARWRRVALLKQTGQEPSPGCNRRHERASASFGCGRSEHHGLHNSHRTTTLRRELWTTCLCQRSAA